MQYTTRRLVVVGGRMIQAEERVARQRRLAGTLGHESETAVLAWSRLAVMEQSLLAIARFLVLVQRDVEDQRPGRIGGASPASLDPAAAPPRRSSRPSKPPLPAS